MYIVIPTAFLKIHRNEMKYRFQYRTPFDNAALDDLTGWGKDGYEIQSKQKFCDARVPYTNTYVLR